MTLTEEQREAIKYAISSLEQCGSEPEDPVVAKILGAMIDSSDHIVEHDELIGFDLEKARDAAKFDDRMAITMFPLAIAEIERLLGEKAFLEKVVHIKNTRLKELEDELVKERTGAIRCESYNHCEGMYEIDLPNAIIRAQTELQAEGKIGPDADAKPHCWQITEERKAAIKELSELLTAIGCPSCHYYIQKNYGEDITVLKEMLKEATD